MRVTVCELPHEPAAAADAWAGLCRHTSEHASELVLLPELAFVDPVWRTGLFEPTRWAAAEALSVIRLQRLSELRATHVVGTRPASVDGRPFNQGFIWSAAGGLAPLRRKFFMPAEPEGGEGRWFDRGDPAFPAFRAGALSFGLNICTELWALETYAAYAARDVQAILSPRATEAATTDKWLSLGVVAATLSGAFSLSSNRVDASGDFGGVGWIISPDGEILASTTPDAPFATASIDLGASIAARDLYPCNVFSSKQRAIRGGAR
jgi:N-carbamoylputrescine amidase